MKMATCSVSKQTFEHSSNSSRAMRSPENNHFILTSTLLLEAQYSCLFMAVKELRNGLALFKIQKKMATRK
jgi:hypothetical protein